MSIPATERGCIKMSNKRKLMISAPTSAVGGNFIKYLGDRYKVVTVGRRESDIVFDFARDTDLKIPGDIDAIVHFAAAMDSSSDAAVMEMIQTNVAGVLKVCMAAKRYGVGFVVCISSISAVYPETSEYYNFYALTKKQMEEAASLYCKKNNIKLCIIRPGQIFGEGCGYEKNQPMLYTMIQKAVENKQICIYGTHDAIRNYIFADNLFRLIEEAIERQAEGMIEAIDPQNYRLSEAAEIIIDKFKSSSEIVFCEEKPDIHDLPIISIPDERENFFDKWKIPFIGFEKAMELVSRQWFKNENKLL